MRLALPLLLAATVLAQDSATYDELRREFDRALTKHWRTGHVARQRGEKHETDDNEDPRLEYVPRFLALAEEHTGTKEAFESLMVVLMYTRDPGEKAHAVKVLLQDHVASKEMRRAIPILRRLRGPEAGVALEKVFRQNPHDEVRGPALLLLGHIAKSRDEMLAIAIFEEVKEKYGEVPGLDKKKLGPVAEAEIFRIKHLSVGSYATEIEGEDIDGKPLKLSDHRGKVVLLDFWGDW